MKRMPLVAVLALLLTTACAHLSVRTEIHDGEGLTQDAKSFARHAEERARATRLAMDTLDTTVVAPLSSRFVDAIASIRQAVPEAVAGTPEQFRDLYLRELSKRTVLALEPEIRRIRDRAVLIETNAATCADNATLRTQLVGMQSDLQQLVEALQTRANENVRAEQEMFVQTVRLAAAAKTNDALATATGFTVSNAAQKSVAVDFLARRAEVAFVDVAASIGKALLAPIEAARTATTETIMLPLGDPNVALIVGKEADPHWRQYVNDVHSTNVLGNSEAAFRMEGLGENHIKSVLFDPSEVSKVGMNVFSTTLRITAAAYGFALPQQEKKDAQGNVVETIPQTSSKAAIDAEIAKIAGDRSVRGLKMEQLFWKSADAAAKVAGTGTDAASAEAVKAIADLIECMAAEIEKPQTKKCGGE